MKCYYDKEKNIWRTPFTQEEDNASIYLDGYLKEKLDNVNILRKKNWDCVFIIVGEEGSGKSTLSFICGQYLSNMSLTMDNIAEGTEDAMEKLQKLPDGSIIIVDEGELLFSSRETMSREQRQLTKIMKIIRQKNMVFILVSPVFFDLSKYIAVDRSKFLLRTVVDKDFNRGFWQYWGQKNKKTLYLIGKKHFGSYSKPKPNLYGRFTNYILPFDEEYKKLKTRSLKEAFEPKKTGKKEDETLKFRIAYAKKLFPQANASELSKIFNCDLGYVAQIFRREQIMQ